MEPELRGVVGESPKVTQLATGFASPSGPVFSRRGYLLFCEAGAAKILKWESGGVTLFRASSNHARALTFDHQGRLLACEKGRLTRTEKDGEITVLASRSDPLDVIYAIDGNIYFCDGTAVHRVKRDSIVVLATRDCQQPRGVALAPNQQKLYVSESVQRTVRVFDISDDGRLEGGRLFAALASATPGPLGGLKTDESGRVWVAAPDGIEVFSRDGNPLGAVRLPEVPGSVNWGEGFRDLIATTPTSVYRISARTNGTRTF